ncbi:MAG: tetratricopeptide repeat protein [Candidatus Omnitrophica bacterium]|nr:tetratricopeptide repeat protein [Candidatus Omnitrophota bacterium]
MELSNKKYMPFFHAALIIILGFIVYSNALNGEFVCDDEFIVKDNIFIKNWSNSLKVFTTDNVINPGEGVTRKYVLYRPMQMLTYMMDYSLFGRDAAGYHLTNILLHILAVLCLYWFISILFADPPLLAFFTSILFLVHPLHTEVVTYISTRSDSLGLLFVLLCLIFYLKQIHVKSVAIYFLTLLSYVLALLSRENSLILCALLLLYHYAFKKKILIPQFFSILGISSLYILFRTVVLKISIANPAYGTVIAERLPGMFVAITNYIRLLLLPFGLHMEYGDKMFSFSHPQSILGITILSSLLIYGFSQRTKQRLIFFSVFWFFIALIPVSNIYPLNAYMSENWLYLPSIGFFLILGWVLSSLYKIKGSRLPAVLFITGLLALYSYLTIRQNTYWKTPRTLYERTLKYAPDSSLACNNLGMIYRNLGKKEEAISLYKKAITANPGYLEAYLNLGVIYGDSGRYEEAIAMYEKAIELNPNCIDAYYNIGRAYNSLGKYTDAVTQFKKALEINPGFEQIYNNLAFSCSALGKTEEAIGWLKKALEIKQDSASTYNNLGNIYNSIGRYQEAVPLLKKAIALNSNLAVAYNNLAVSYYNTQQYDLAVQYCDRAIGLGHKVKPEFLEQLKPYRQNGNP